MKLYTYENLPETEVLLEFKDNSWRGFFYATLVFLAITAFVAWPKGGAEKTELAVVPGAVALFFAAYGALRFRQYRLHNNWILRVTPDGLLVNLRSHYHYFFPRHLPCVLHLDSSEIAAVGVTQVKRRIPLNHGEAKENHSYVDLYVNFEDLQPAAAAIRRERRLALEYPSRKITPHFPVQIIAPPGVRLRWEWMEPREHKAITLLSDHYPLAPDRKVVLPAWEQMDAPARDAFIRELWESGQVEDAARLIGKEHNLTPRQVREWIRQHLEPAG